MTARKILWSIIAVSALSDVASANVVGSELQNFNAAPTGNDGVTVSSGRTLGEGRFSLGLFSNIAVNSLPYFQDGTSANRDRSKKVNDTVTAVDFQIAYGLTDRWDLSLAMPSIVAQNIRNEDDYHGEFERLGPTELRFGSKYQVLQSEGLQLALQATVNYNRVDGNPYTGNVRWPGASLELVLSTQIAFIDWSVNVGHRWRESRADPEIRAQLPIDPAGDQWLASTSVAFDLPSTDTDLVAEVYSAYAEHVIADVSSRKSAIVEAVLGFRTPLPYNLQFHGGIGSEVNHSESSSDLRAYIGIRWVPEMKRRAAVEAVTSAPEPIVKVASTGVLDRAPDAVVIWDDIYFKFDSTEFRDSLAQTNIDRLSAALQARPVERVIIEGYTCDLGSEDYNFDLADHRAATIERILIQEHGIAPEKLVTVGWGEKNPKFDNAKEQTRMNNRRVTFRIFYQKELPSSSQNVAH